MLEEPRRLNGAASPSTWMYRVATRLCIDRLRKYSRHRRLLEGAASAFDGPDGSGTAEARIFLDWLWRKLDDELVMIGILYYIDGMTTADIAATLGVSDRTIANRLTKLATEARAAADDRGSQEAK